MKVQVLLAALALLAPRPGQSERYCGKDLAETLVKYCSSFADNMGKRSDTWMRTQLFGTGYWLTPHQALAMGRGKRQGGIASECCDKPCTLNELLSYCPV